MKDLMVDIETFGNGKLSCLTQLGGVYFDRYTGETGDTFKINIDARDAVKQGGQMDADTVYWWLSQSKEAIESVCNPPLHPLRFAMEQFYKFAKSADFLWSHATFDFVIIQENYKMLGMKPLRYKAGLDLRTLVHLSGVSYDHSERVGTHHDALDDCRFQVGYSVPAFNILKERKDAQTKSQ